MNKQQRRAVLIDLHTKRGDRVKVAKLKRLYWLRAEKDRKRESKS